jgi:cyclase
VLKNRVIPTLLWKDFGLVKDVGFKSGRRVGSVEQSVRIFNSRDVDELVLLDITATEQNRAPRFKEIMKFSEWTSVPFSIGGGIQNIDHAEKLFENGADKIVINSMVYIDRTLIPRLSTVFGSQCIVVSVDYRLVNGVNVCFKNNGRINTEIKLEEWIKEIAQMGAGEVLITNCERDGARNGYDIETLKSVSSLTDTPLIANGGAGSISDIKEVFMNTGIRAVGVGSLFQFTEITPHQLRESLMMMNFPMRSTSRIMKKV